MKKTSGGLVLYKEDPENNELFVLVAHPGGPFFKDKDDGWWSIPKGEPEPNEDIFLAALREFEEETGMPPSGPFLDLGSIVQNNGKIVFAWAFEGDWEDSRTLVCNKISMEYPKGSGKIWEFPEIDRVAFLPIENAKEKLRPQQVPLLERLMEKVSLAKDSRAS
jgi:predicted NUDIX family NTP pyrophosphohydrolase|tara:strand:- start:3815 stop:4306 length:492 start_codon:yes stop_codon:yes gene_type:complete